MFGPLLFAIAVSTYPAVYPTVSPGEAPAPPPAVGMDAAAPTDTGGPAAAGVAPPPQVPSTPADGAAPPTAPAPSALPDLLVPEPPAAPPSAPPTVRKQKDHRDVPNGEAVDDDASLFGTSGDPFGDTIRGEVLSFRLLLQARYADEWPVSQPRDNSIEGDRDIVNATENDGWRMNRLFLRAIAKPRKWIQGRLLLDFAELRWGSRRGTVKLAYLVLKPLPRTRVTVGLFKRPYSLLELLPIADFEFADVGPTDEVIKELGFGGRDMGAMVQVEPLAVKRWMNLSAGMFAGDSEGRYAAVAGLVAARVESSPLRMVRLGADASYRPRRTLTVLEDTVDYKGVDSLDRGGAVSGDVSLAVGRMEVRAEGLYGKRVDIMSRLNDGTGFYVGDCPSGNCHWLAGWGLVTYRVPVGKRGVLMPAVRAEWLEMNREQHLGKRTYLTGALDFDVTPELRLLVDVTWRHVQPKSPSLNQLNQWITFGSEIYDLSGTRLTLQAQLRI
jgi:hypothetical protein